VFPCADEARKPEFASKEAIGDWLSSEAPQDCGAAALIGLIIGNIYWLLSARNPKNLYQLKKIAMSLRFLFGRTWSITKVHLMQESNDHCSGQAMLSTERRNHSLDPAKLVQSDR
jgi:hypothetical protein